MTFASTCPKISCNKELLKIMIMIINTLASKAVIKINCLAEYWAFFIEPWPINCDATTAPPVARAEKILINKTLIPSTNDTADTAASPTLATITVSEKPTSITSICSIINGIISFFKSWLLNNIKYPPNGFYYIPILYYFVLFIVISCLISWLFSFR